jgi:hypothetical protein
LLISILAKAATIIVAKRTTRGVVPALLRTKVARYLSILHLESAAARVKPPSKSIMTGVHMDEKMYLAAALESSLSSGITSECATRSTTQRNGMMSEVTNRGIA